MQQSKVVAYKSSVQEILQTRAVEIEASHAVRPIWVNSARVVTRGSRGWAPQDQLDFQGTVGAARPY